MHAHPYQHHFCRLGISEASKLGLKCTAGCCLFLVCCSAAFNSSSGHGRSDGCL